MHAVPLVQSLSFFQSVLHSGEQLINNYKALMSPFHIKLFCMYNKSFCWTFFCFFSLLLSRTHSTHSSRIWISYSVSINFYFRQLFILFDYQLSAHEKSLLLYIFFCFIFLPFLHFSTLVSHSIFHLTVSLVLIQQFVAELFFFIISKWFF